MLTLVCATIDLSPLLTPLTSRRKKTSEFLSQKNVCRSSTHNGGDGGLPWTGFVKKALKDERGRELCSRTTLKEHTWSVYKVPFSENNYFKFRDQIVPILNYELWLICGFPQRCKMATTSHQRELFGELINVFVLLLACLFKLYSLRLQSLSSTTMRFDCVIARLAKSMTPGRDIAAAHWTLRGLWVKCRGQNDILRDVTTTWTLTFNL